ncbi:MAG: type I-F CRISPR-associated endoribonuclease Cas6/Csy4 [Bacteroidota bacterium]
MYRVDIKIKSSIHKLENYIMEIIFGRLHDMLVKMQDKDKKVKIGIGFPKYSVSPRTLGNTLTLFGPKEELEAINLNTELNDVINYISIGEVTKTKDTGKYYSFRRQRYRHSPENRIKKAMKRKGYTRKEAEQKYMPYINMDKPRFNYPYLNYESKSTGQSFPFMIKREKTEKRADKFNAYGLDYGEERRGVPV